MSTEIGSSSAANVSRELALDITAMYKCLEQQFSIGCLISVPDHLRKLDEQAFTPLLISIGPVHRSNAKLQNMKKCKVQFCGCYIQRANINLEDKVNKIREREKEIRSYYKETIVSSINSDDFVTMIVVDGMFILEYFLRESDTRLVGNDRMIAEWMPPILKFDLVILDNQLPFFVLKMLFEPIGFGGEEEPLSLEELAFSFFQCYNFQRRKAFEVTAGIENFTDLVRLFYLSGKLSDRSFGEDKLSYSATQLHEAGVKLKGIEFNEMGGCFVDKRFQRFDLSSGMGCDRSRSRFLDIRYLLREAFFMLRGVAHDKRMELETAKFERGRRGFLDIRFDNGVLEIPCVKLNDEKVRLIRNIIALEQSYYVGHTYVTDFFVILDFLIDNSKDVDLLCDKGILINYLGDSNAAASAVNNLNTNILWDYMNSKYSVICGDLNAFYKKPWHRWKAMLWRQYFSTPWRVASTTAAILLLLLTATQTICSLRST